LAPFHVSRIHQVRILFVELVLKRRQHNPHAWGRRAWPAGLADDDGISSPSGRAFYRSALPMLGFSQNLAASQFYLFVNPTGRRKQADNEY
jgi:hypothetical protein